jgi:hypothetical protein
VEIIQSMYGGATIKIQIIYPELGNIDLNINGASLRLVSVDLEVMLSLVNGLDVSKYVSLLSEDRSTHGKSYTKQDIIDFIENLIADRALEADVAALKAELTVVEDDDDASAV